MPVYKFHSVAEMEATRWRTPGDPDLFRAIRTVWTLAARMSQARFPPGVYKHASIASADALRDAWEQARFDAAVTRRKTRESGSS